MQFPERPYASLNAGELADEYERICRELAAANGELAEVKVQRNWMFLRGYKDSTATSVSGRDRDGEMSSISIREDELRLEGQIAALSVMRDMLTVFVMSGSEVKLV